MGQKVALGWRTLKLKQRGQSVYVRVRRGYENVLNAIMEDGEATVLGLRRSKPLFFLGRELFLFKTAPQKTSSEPCHIPIWLEAIHQPAEPINDMSPIRAPIKSAPFPWNISKHFDGSGFSPAGSLESVTPPHPTRSYNPHPHLHHHRHPLHGPHILCISATGSSLGETEGAEEGESSTEPFSQRSPWNVHGKRMHCGLLEEPDMDSTGWFLLHRCDIGTPGIWAFLERKTGLGILWPEIGIRKSYLTFRQGSSWI